MNLNIAKFNEETKAKLVAAGFSPAEMMCGALMAEMHAALRLVREPLAAMALSQTFSKAMALISLAENADAGRVTQAADVVLEAGIVHAKGLARGMTVETAKLDDAPAVNPKDIN